MKKVIRFILYLGGLAVLSLGVVLNTKTGLGVSPINSVPYVFSQITGISLGVMTAILYMICVLIESLMMGKRWKPKVLLQIPFSILFGVYVNLFNGQITYQAEGIVMQIVMQILAILLISLGAYVSVTMDIVPNAPDGLAQEMGVKMKKSYGSAKNVLDIICVSLTCIIGLVLAGRVIGIGIGTVICALVIGQVIRLIGRVLQKPLQKVLF